MTTLEKIGKAIKDLRVNKGLSQEQFCTQCHIDQHYISNIENGHRNLSIEFVERIAKFFNLTLVEFFLKVDTIEASSKSKDCSVLMKNTSQESFAKFMERQKLSENTIKKYSSDVPNSMNVKAIITDITGLTDNMYHVTDHSQLEMIIERVANEEFDKVGQRMYSCGLKKYVAYLESIK